MPGGRLVVLDRLGRDVKRYPLPEGMATLGSDNDCDIRFMLSSVSPTHATVVVRANQTTITDESESGTLVNGRPVSVAALRHGDVITIGDRSLRWEYEQPEAVRDTDNASPLVIKKPVKRRRGRKSTGDITTRRLDPEVRLMLELNHPSRTPGSPGGDKQVAIVQPQQRYNNDVQGTKPRLMVNPHRPYALANKRRRNSKSDLPKQDNNTSTAEKTEGSKRKTSTPRTSTYKTPDLQSTTKATMWIESRKSAPTKSATVTSKPEDLKSLLIPRANKTIMPMGSLVLRRVSAPNVSFVATLGKKTPIAKVAKIQAPSKIDHTKQAALMLMSKALTPKATTKSTPKKTPQSTKSQKSAKKTPLGAKKSSTSVSLTNASTRSDTPSRTTEIHSVTRRRLRASSGITFESPRKSSMKDPRAKKGNRKTESIKFDLSNLDNYQEDLTDVTFASNNSTNECSYMSSSVSDTDINLHDSYTSAQNYPSPRKSIHSKIFNMSESIDKKGNFIPVSPSTRRSMRGCLMIQKVMQTPVKNTVSMSGENATIMSTPESPRDRKSERGSLMVQTSRKKSSPRHSTNTLKSESDQNATIWNMSKIFSPRSPKITTESYPIVDLVSIDSDESRSLSIYDSIGSKSTAFGTPQITSARKTRSTIDPTLLASSTPYVGKKNRPTISIRRSDNSPIDFGSTYVEINKSSLSTRRSTSLTNAVSSRVSKSSPIKFGSESLEIKNKSSISKRRSKSLTNTGSGRTSFASNRSSLSIPGNDSTRLSRASRILDNSTIQISSPIDKDSSRSSRSNTKYPHVLKIPELCIPKLPTFSETKSPSEPATKSHETTPMKSPKISGTVSARQSATNSPGLLFAKSPRLSAEKLRRKSSTKSTNLFRSKTPQAKSPRISGTVSPTASATNSPRLLFVKSLRLSAEKSLRMSTLNSSGPSRSKTPQAKSPSISETVSPRAPATNSPGVVLVKSSRLSAEKLLRMSTTKSSRLSRSKTPQAKPARISGTVSPRPSMTNSPRFTAEKSPRISTTKSPNLSRSKTPQAKSPRISGTVSPRASATNSPALLFVKSPRLSSDKLLRKSTTKSSRLSRSKTPQAKTARISGSVSPRASSINSPRFSAEKSPRISTTKSPNLSRSKTPQAKSPRISGTVSPRASMTNSPRFSAEKSPRISTTKSPNLSRSKTPQAESPRISGTVLPRASATNSPALVFVKSPRLSAKKSLIMSTTKSSRLSRSKTPQAKTATISGTVSPRASTNNSPRLLFVKSPRFSAKKSPIMSTTKLSKTPQAKSPRISGNVSLRTSGNNSPALVFEKSPRLSAEKSLIMSTTNSSRLSGSNSPQAKTARISGTVSPRASATNSPRLLFVKSPRFSAKKSPRKSTTKSPKLSRSKTPQAKSPRISRTLSLRASATNSPALVFVKSPRLSAEKSLIMSTTKSSRLSRSNAPQAKTTRMSATKSPRISAVNSPVPIKSARDSSAYSTRISAAILSKTRNSQKSNTLNISSSPVSEGLHTPDNAHSPQDSGTPILSIQNLLDSSNLSLLSENTNKGGRTSLNRVWVKRKTIGVLKRGKPRLRRSQVNSKSINLPVTRKGFQRMSEDSSSASDRTDEGASKPTNEKTITPKSSMKIAPVAVKEKHSTAKKPQSKRAIIDNLNDSIVEKSLFNSPVKRKLSQSMTEFSRTQVFGEMDLGSGRRTRQSNNASTPTPDESIFNHSAASTPEQLGSPFTTPKNSPHTSALKRVHRSAKWYRTRKSANDLTNISGVKQLFTNSPRNRLSDLRGVKEVFTSACSPANDLRRVSGVSSLFQSKITRNSPKNDLSDVRGIKKLYQRKSPKNDLRNVSGVKRIMKKRSIKNDIRDVRGVKELFARENSKDGLNDLSGVEELFETSFDSHKNQSALQNSKSCRIASRSETLLDQLISKPRSTANYAKSFCAKPTDNFKKKRSAKSLNESFDLISNNIEEWLEKEIQERRKDVTLSNASTSKSINKIKTPARQVTRELASLVTDTVEGSVPVMTSRTRYSILLKSQDGISERKTASQRFSTNSLPIKKRSISQSALGDSANKKSVLPIKKRVLLHSTPVKTKFHGDADGTLALGRVSPIIADRADVQEAPLRITRQAQASPKPKEIATKYSSDVVSSKNKSGGVSIENKSKSISSKTTTSDETRQIKSPTPKKNIRTTSGTKTAEVSKVNIVKECRTPLVIKTKTPVIEPVVPMPTRTLKKNTSQKKKSGAVRLQNKAKTDSPKSENKSPTQRGTRTTRSKVIAVVQTDLTGQGRRRASFVTKKKAPVLSPAGPIPTPKGRRYAKKGLQKVETIPKGNSKATSLKASPENMVPLNELKILISDLSKKAVWPKSIPEKAAIGKNVACPKPNTSEARVEAVLSKVTPKKATRRQKAEASKPVTPELSLKRSTRNTKVETTKAGPKKISRSQKPKAPRAVSSKKAMQVLEYSSQEKETATSEARVKAVLSKVTPKKATRRQKAEASKPVTPELSLKRSTRNTKVETTKAGPKKTSRSQKAEAPIAVSSKKAMPALEYPRQGKQIAIKPTAATMAVELPILSGGRKRKANTENITIPVKKRCGKQSKAVEVKETLNKNAVETNLSGRKKIQKADVKTAQEKKIQATAKPLQTGRKTRNAPEPSTSKESNEAGPLRATRAAVADNNPIARRTRQKNDEVKVSTQNRRK